MAEKPKLDGSRNAALTPCHLPDGRVVSWAEAFPRDWAALFRDDEERRS